MLTRLKVNGFKNLVDVDVRFGPFTCIAGANGVGKSNLLDSITFMSALAEKSLNEAALSVRDDGSRTGDLRTIFRRIGDSYSTEMSLEAEMVVPAEGFDDLGQLAKPSIRFLRYKLILAYREGDSRGFGRIELLHEELSYIHIGDAKKQIAFPISEEWRKTAITGRRTTPFISTDSQEGGTRIKVHQDSGSSGRARELLASSLPRTVVSAADAAESPTVVLAKREMQSWRRLQLEPSALRRPDSFTSPTVLGSDGSHLPATLYFLAKGQGFSPSADPSGRGSDVYARIANRLSSLIDDVREVYVDRDERRELLTLTVSGRDRTPHAARSLSDGTLRFLALGTIELDPRAHGVICLEEPENGIHPARIRAILDLLRDIATDTDYPVSEDNPLRQVIINTHSPAVVGEVPDDSLIVAESLATIRDGIRFERLAFSYLPNTWRGDDRIVFKSKLLAYLNPVGPAPAEADILSLAPKKHRRRRVFDREDLQGAFDWGKHIA